MSAPGGGWWSRAALRALAHAAWRSVRRLWHQVEWFIVAALLVVAFVLGWVGFDRVFGSLGQSQSRWDLCYLTLQLLVLQSGTVPGPVPWQLEVARFLAPAVAAYTAVKALAVVFA